MHIRRVGELGNDEFQHAVIDQADQAQLLRNRDDIWRQQLPSSCSMRTRHS